MNITQKISPCLWFDANAEEAVNHYLSIFDHSAILNVMRYHDAGPGAPGSVLAISFELGGPQLIAMNGGPAFRFNEAISLFVSCDNQAEIDRLWDRLLEGGSEQQCGWLKDRFGVSWQIVPAILGEMLCDADSARATRVMQAMMPMVKIDIRTLEQAYRN